ncbi:MAG: four helix bundle protein [Bacteroidota bacterium]
MGENILQVKSFRFAIEMVELYKQLSTEKREFVLSKQILKSGTSIGANVEEAIGGQSEADFMSKLSIAYKESRETSYWLRLLEATNYIEPEIARQHLASCEELQRIIGSSIKTIKAKRMK